MADVRAKMRAQLRLARDLRFLKANPIEGVAAVPLDDNFFLWHANFELQPGVVIHFEIHFPYEYPLYPPSVFFATGFPHLNCFPKRSPDGRAMYHLCLNMLGNETNQSNSTSEDPGSGWSSAYDAHGLLMQIQAFLLDGKAARQRHNGLNIEEAVRRATKYSCPHCSHSPETFFPAIKSVSSVDSVGVAIRRPLLCGIAGLPKSAKKTHESVPIDEEWKSVDQSKELEPEPAELWQAFQCFIVRSACAWAASPQAKSICEMRRFGPSCLTQQAAAVAIQRHVRAASAQKLRCAIRLLGSSRSMRLALKEYAVRRATAQLGLRVKQENGRACYQNATNQISSCKLKIQNITNEIACGGHAILDRERLLTREQINACEEKRDKAIAKVARIVTRFAKEMVSFQSQSSEAMVEDTGRKLRAAEKTLKQMHRLLAMQQDGIVLLPEQIAKIDRHDTIKDAYHFAHSQHQSAQEAHSALLCFPWQPLYEELFRTEVNIIENTAMHEHQQCLYEESLEKHLDEIRAAHQLQNDELAKRQTELDEQLRELQNKQAVATRAWCNEDATCLTTLGAVEKALSGLLDDAVHRRKALVELCQRAEELQARKAGGKKLSPTQRSVLKFNEEHVAELRRLETQADISLGFELQLFMKHAYDCASRVYGENVSLLEKLRSDDLYSFMPDEQVKKARALAKVLRQVQELEHKKTFTTEQRSKFHRRDESQVLLEKIQGEATSRKVQVLAEQEEVCEHLKMRCDVVLSLAHVDVLQEWVSKNNWATLSIQAYADARQDAAKTLTMLASQRAICNVDTLRLRDHRQNCREEAETSQVAAKRKAAEQQNVLDDRRKEREQIFLQQKEEARTKFASLAGTQVLASFEARRLQFLSTARQKVEALIRSDSELVDCRLKLDSLDAPDALAKQEYLLSLAVRERAKLEEDIASHSQVLVKNSLDDEQMLASFQRQYGEEAQIAALEVWSQFRFASIRIARKFDLQTMWEAWRLGLGVACKCCGILVPRQNITVHEAHCESLCRFAPKNGETYLSKLPYQILVHSLLRFLTHADLLILSVLGNRKIATVAEDGFLWREELHRMYPKSSLNASNMKDWKYVFMCEMNQVVAGLSCFHTKSTFNDEGVVLGVPISFTVNPKKQCTDYIRSTMDLLSYDAFKLDQVRQTVWREEFTHWLPMYICEDHWQRSKILLMKSVLPLLPHWHTTKFQPEMCLEVFCKSVNTLVVLLCDRGEHFSETVAKSFCMWHRWMLRCIEEWPEIQKSVEKRIGDFCRGESSRSKDKEPNIGEFIALLLVSERFTWNDVVGHLLSEWMDRQVLWCCTEHPCLDQIGAKDSLSDTQRVELSWSAKPVGRRLYAFHAVFLEIFKRSMSRSEVAAQYDLFYGQPTPSCLKQISKAFQAVMAMENWPHLFKILRVQCPSKTKLAELLRKAVDSSARRGYHKRGMDFQKVHQSGVSKILKKGESYRAAADLKIVELQDFWAWHGEKKFLDATCFVYDEFHTKLGLLDYQNTTCGFLGGEKYGVITHSGDILDDRKQSGTHSIVVHLDKLPAKVHYLYFVLSAWDGKFLSDIMQPHVCLLDQQTGSSELCRYNVEATRDANRRSSILMCVLHRRVERSSQSCPRWELKAIGEIGNGAANDYGPIEQMIHKYAKK
jgi:ubiquitin-protein ligase/stress response protein SCP2